MTTRKPEPKFIFGDNLEKLKCKGCGYLNHYDQVKESKRCFGCGRCLVCTTNHSEMSSLREADGTVGSINDAQLRALFPILNKWGKKRFSGWSKIMREVQLHGDDNVELALSDLRELMLETWEQATSRAAQKQKEQDGLFAGGKRYKYHIAFLTRRAYNNHIKAVQEQSADKARSDYLKSKELALLIEAHEDKARKSETKAWQDCIQLEVDQARKDERAKVLKEIEQLTSKPEGSGAVKLYITFKDWEILKQAKKVR